MKSFYTDTFSVPCCLFSKLKRRLQENGRCTFTHSFWYQGWEQFCSLRLLPDTGAYRNREFQLPSSQLQVSVCPRGSKSLRLMIILLSGSSLAALREIPFLVRPQSVLKRPRISLLHSSDISHPESIRERKLAVQ